MPLHSTRWSLTALVVASTGYLALAMARTAAFGAIGLLIASGCGPLISLAFLARMQRTCGRDERSRLWTVHARRRARHERRHRARGSDHRHVRISGGITVTAILVLLPSLAALPPRRQPALA